MPRKRLPIERMRLVGLVLVGLTTSAEANPSVDPLDANRQGHVAAGLTLADADDAAPAPASPAKTRSKTESEAKTPASTDASVEALRQAWMEARKQIFAGKHQYIADSEDPDTVNHLNWYEATGFTRPYPGETTVRPPSDFKDRFTTKEDNDD